MKNAKDTIRIEGRTITIQSSLFLLSFLALTLTLASCTKDDENGTNDDDGMNIAYVEFADEELELAVAKALGKDKGPINTMEILELTELNVNGSSLASFGGLEYAENLEKLEARALEIESLVPISKIPSLRYLDLRTTIIPGGGLEFLDGITGLTYLDLRGTGLSDISHIALLTLLEEIHLRDNAISDLSPLSGLINLTYLNIHSNILINDLTPVTGLENLEVLIARNVPFGNEGMNTIANFTQLHRLNMRNTGVTDLSVLANLMAQGALQNENAPNNTAILDIRQIEAGDFCVIYPYINDIAELDGGDFSDCE